MKRLIRFIRDRYPVLGFVLFGLPPAPNRGERTVHITTDGGRTWINTGKRGY